MTTLLLVSDSIMGIPKYLKEYLKRTFNVKTICNYVFSGKRSSFFLGRFGLMNSIMPNHNIKFILFNFGQNDWSRLKCTTDHAEIHSLADILKDNLRDFAKRNSNCTIIVLPLLKRKVSKRFSKFHPKSSMPDWIMQINIAITLFCNRLSTCDTKNVLIVPSKPSVVDEALSDDGLHYCQRGKEISLAMAVTYWKKSLKQ